MNNSINAIDLFGLQSYDKSVKDSFSIDSRGAEFTIKMSWDCDGVRANNISFDGLTVDAITVGTGLDSGLGFGPVSAVRNVSYDVITTGQKSERKNSGKDCESWIMKVRVSFVRNTSLSSSVSFGGAVGITTHSSTLLEYKEVSIDFGCCCSDRIEGDPVPIDVTVRPPQPFTPIKPFVARPLPPILPTPMNIEFPTI